MEIWKSIEGYDNYQISDKGRIRNIKRNKILKLHASKEGYLFIGLYKNNKRKTYLIHRLLCFYFKHNPENKTFVDHINGNKLDNRLENLRFCTRSENSKNRKAHGTSKYLGVSWNKHNKQWETRINIKGKRTHLGRYKDEVEAAKAYDIAAKEHHGEFANPNFK